MADVDTLVHRLDQELEEDTRREFEKQPAAK